MNTVASPADRKFFTAGDSGCGGSVQAIIVSLDGREWTGAHGKVIPGVECGRAFGAIPGAAT